MESLVLDVINNSLIYINEEGKKDVMKVEDVVAQVLLESPDKMEEF